MYECGVLFLVLLCILRCVAYLVRSLRLFCVLVLHMIDCGVVSFYLFSGNLTLTLVGSMCLVTANMSCRGRTESDAAAAAAATVLVCIVLLCGRRLSPTTVV